MYALVNDVVAYPQFVQHCIATEVLEASETAMCASLSLQRTGVSLLLKTENTLIAPSDTQAGSIVMHLVEGPFTDFEGRWQFTPLRAGACKVSLHITFSMNNAVTSRVAGSLFESIGNSLVDAFCRRAEHIYGRPGAVLS